MDAGSCGALEFKEIRVGTSHDVIKYVQSCFRTSNASIVACAECSGDAGDSAGNDGAFGSGDDNVAVQMKTWHW